MHEIILSVPDIQNTLKSMLSDLHWQQGCHSVRSSTTCSAVSAVSFGVPQGSVLEPILFLLYTADLLQLVRHHQFHPHAYADDTQIYGSYRPSDVDELRERLSVCIEDVSFWMAANRLLLNPAKTEVLWCSSSRRRHQIPSRPI